MRDYHHSECKCYDNNNPSRMEIALHYALWEEYVDCDNNHEEDEWEGFTLQQKLDFIDECFDEEE